MTSLANQLKSLALPHTQALLGDEKKRVSLLFDPTEAANLDREAIFAIGIGGLEELIEIDSIFMEYEKSLFNETATGLQRLTQSSEVNKKLDEAVRVFLVHLSPYFLLRPAHKALEWLIYRYQVHFYNIDDLLMCTLPYHDSNIFIRVLQILNLSSPKSKWHWLEQVQKAGTHLPCLTMATHAYKDEGFLNFISSIPEQFIQVHGYEKTGTNSPVHAAVSFYTKILLNSVQQANPVKDSFVAQVTTFLLKGLKSRNDEFKCSSYMILSTICSKVTLDERFLASVLPLLTKRMTIRNGFEALSCLLLVFKTQEAVSSLPKKSFKHLCRLPGIVQHLTQLHQWGVLDTFWTHLLNRLVPAAIKDCRQSVTSSSDGGGDGGELTPGKPEYWSLLQSLLSDVTLSDRHASRIIELMCEGYIENKAYCHTESMQDKLSERIKAMLRLVEQKYSTIVDSQIRKQMESTSDSDLMQEFARMTLSSFKYQATDEGTNLTLSLNHSESSIRKHGVKQLLGILSKKSKHDNIDREFVSSSLYARLLDKSEDVADAVFQGKSKYLLDYLSTQQLIQIIKSASKPIAVKCCKVLSGGSNCPSMSGDNSELYIEYIRLILTLAYDEKNKPVLEALSMKHELDMFQGCGADADMEELVTAAANFLKKEGNTNQVKLILEDTSAALDQVVCHILLELCEDKDGMSDSFHCEALNLLMTLCQAITEQGGNSVGVNEILKEFADMFRETAGSWLSSQYAGDVYTSYLTLLVESKKAALLVNSIRDWDQFEQQVRDELLIRLLSTQTPVLTANLLHAVEILKVEVFMNVVPIHDSTVACLIGLLTHEEKRIRLAVIKVLAKLNMYHDHHTLKQLVQRIAEQSREIIADPFHICETIDVFMSEVKKSVSSRAALLGVISSPNTPTVLCKNLLTAFSTYRDPVILEGTGPLLRRLLDTSKNTDVQSRELLEVCLLRYDENSAKLFEKQRPLFDAFIDAMTNPLCQLAAIQQVTKQFYNALSGNDLKQAVFSKCLDVNIQSQNPEVHAAINKLVRHITLPAEVVLPELIEPVKSLGQDQSLKTKKRRRYEAATDSAPSDVGSAEWRRVRIVLEWLQNKKKISNASIMLPTLFKLISQLLDMDHVTGCDYIKHLLMGCLDNLLNKLSQSEDEQDTVTSDALNMELVVQCIRTSKNPQTHQQALLLLRTTARMFPDIVLHHVMSIFTYMGANIMRQDDMYSFQIITNTLDTVVPEIVKASGSTADYTITGIIRVFVDAYPHIPEHRRLPLFTKLLQTVGEEKYLYACTCLCVEGLVTKNPIPDTTNEYEWKSESNQLVFLLSLYANFSVECQLRACASVLEFLCTLPAQAGRTPAPTVKRSTRKSTAPAKSSISDGLYDVSLYTDKQLRHFKYELAGFVVSAVSASTFISQVVNADADHSKSFNGILEVGLRYISLVAKEAERHSEQPTAKFWRALLHKVYEILDKVNALLPGAVFINVISSLLEHELPIIRRKAMDLLNNRLPQTVFSKNEISSLIGLITLIKSIALDPNPRSEESEDTNNRQTALYSLKIMTRLLASADSTPFAELLPQACEAFERVHMSAVRANILLLLGELVSQLKINALPHLPSAIPKIIDTLKKDSLLEGNHLLWISAVTALQKVVETIPNFVSQYLLDIVVIVTQQSSKVMTGSDTYKGYKSQLPVRLKSLRDTLAKEFSPRVLVPVLIKCYPLISKESKSVECLMGIIADHIEHMSKDDLSTHHHKLLEMFLMALDYRANNHQEDPSDIKQTEDSIIQATLKMVIKLSEASFRPMYFKLYGWATRETEISDRLISFYRLSDCIAHTLRGLFTLFASHIVKNAASVLDSCNSANKESSSSGLFTDDDHEDDKNELLCKSVIDCLHKCFLYDTEGFVNKQRFNVLMQPLVDQLESDFDDYDDYINSHVVPCISQLAIAVGDDSMWKPLIYQVCLKTRHSKPQVRKGSLYVLRNLNSRLGEDFMPLLPETIPFLAELMEDDEEEVETLCQEVIADMESVLGEPLQKYF